MAPLLRLALCAAGWLLRVACASFEADHLSTCSSSSYSNSTSSSVSEQCSAHFPATSTASSSSSSSSSSWHVPSTGDPAIGFQLTIGVKSSVIHGAESRRAIRETWGSALPADIRVVFLGCQPDLSHYNTTERQHIQDEITTEQLQHGDLLIDELRSCRDAYDDLVNKVLAFFEWTTSTPAVDPTTTKAFVMVADDDVYIRLDRLRQLLMLDVVASTRFYAGQVWAMQFDRAMTPRRDALNSKYYLPFDDYPMSELPPFANGPHYILSADITRFLGQHRAMFRGVGGERSSSSTSVGMLDDVSVALWTLAMQIHPTHMMQFSNLRDFLCRNEMISLADITAAAMRQIHANLRANRSFCSEFHFPTWLKGEHVSDSGPASPDQNDPKLEAQLDRMYYSIRAERRSELYPVHLELEISLLEESKPVGDTVRVLFSPFSTGFFSFCEATARHVQAAWKIPVTRGKLFCRQLRHQLVSKLENLLQRQPTLRPIMRLLQHNIGSEEPAPAVTVAVAPSARYAMVVIECLLTHAYPGTEIFVLDESDGAAWKSRRPPDIVVFAPASVTSNLDKQHEIVKAFVNKYARTSRMVMLGHLERLDKRVIVLSPRVPLSQQLYLPAASIAFAATERHSPTQLLQPFKAAASSPRQRQFCIDQYSERECDLPHRQYFFTLLNGLDQVDAIGACPGNRQTKSPNSYSAKNETIFYLNEMAELFAGYKFVIAFEDSVNSPGSVNDKIVAAFLAGAVPIYYGHSATATQLFNPRAFIDCGAFPSLRACASHVLAVHASASLYDALRREAPIVNMTSFVDAFSWHPDVEDLVSSQRVGSAGGNSGELLGEQLKLLLDNHLS